MEAAAYQGEMTRLSTPSSCVLILNDNRLRESTRPSVRKGIEQESEGRGWVWDNDREPDRKRRKVARGGQIRFDLEESYLSSASNVGETHWNQGRNGLFVEGFNFETKGVVEATALQGNGHPHPEHLHATYQDVYQLASLEIIQPVGTSSKALFMASPLALSLRCLTQRECWSAALRESVGVHGPSLKPDDKKLKSAIVDVFHLIHHFNCWVDQSACCADFDRRWLVRSAFKTEVAGDPDVHHGLLHLMLLDRLVSLFSTMGSQPPLHHIYVDPGLHNHASNPGMHNLAVDNLFAIRNWRDVAIRFKDSFLAQRHSNRERSGQGVKTVLRRPDSRTGIIIKSLLDQVDLAKGWTSQSPTLAEGLICLAAVSLKLLMIVSKFSQHIPLDVSNRF
jgi:hypothetical protein